MNNARIALDRIEEKVEGVKTKLREREQSLINIIDAIQGISQSKQWSSLKTEIFDSLVVRLEKELRDEAKKDDPSSNKLNRIAGQLKWAERYSDLTKLESSFRVELSNVRLQLYGKTE